MLTHYFIRRCQHIKTNGIPCGSPAQRGGAFCYFHKRWRKHHPRYRAPQVTLSPRLAQTVQELVQQRHISWSRLVDELVELGLKAQQSSPILSPEA